MHNVVNTNILIIKTLLVFIQKTLDISTHGGALPGMNVKKKYSGKTFRIRVPTKEISSLQLSSITSILLY
jgi:hypothetical protein